MKQRTCVCQLRGLRLVFMGLCVSIGTLLACSSSFADSPAPVRIAGSAWVGDAPTWVADRLGYFNRGLTDEDSAIEVQLHGSGLEALQKLLTGEADFALAATTPTAMALAGMLDDSSGSSAQVAVLASIALSNQSHYVISPAATGIQSPEQLAGRRVGVMFGTSSHYGWTRFSAFHGLDDTRIELVDMPVTGMAASLRAGEIDAAVIWQPWDLTLREELDEPVTIFPMRLLYTINWLLLTQREFVAEHPDVAERVLRAYIDAIKVIDSDPQRALQLHSTAIDVGADTLAPLAARMFWRVAMNWSVLVNLGTQFEWLATWPDGADLIAPPPREYLYGGPLRRLAPELVTLPDYLLDGGGR